MNKDIKIGLFGFGVVGQGLYEVLNNSNVFRANIEKFVVKHKNKQRSLPKELFYYDRSAILEDVHINTVVELIDDADTAYQIVAAALKNGKDVVTANKKMLALHLEDLYCLQQETGKALLYEASSCGGIPIIRTLEEYYDNESLIGVEGIFNGSSNYILTQLANGGQTFENALKEAQELGFAESDPTLDVEGYDALYKLVIIAAHAFGLWLTPDDVPRLGISQIKQPDLLYAQKHGYTIKQIASVKKTEEGKLSAAVLPTFVPLTNQLAQVKNEYNAVLVEAAFSDKQFFMGKGAGGYPTGSAVLSDISACSYGYRYGYKKHHTKATWKLENQSELKIYFRFPKTSTNSFLSFERIDQKFEDQTYQYIIGQIKAQSIKDISSWPLEDFSVVSF